MNEDVRQALDVARSLAAAGIPVFVAYPDPSKPTGYRLPGKWETTTPNPAYVDAWKSGLALCAVMGHGLDLVDVDPRNGGEVAALDGMMPEVLGMASSPSGGEHMFVRSMGVGSRDGVLTGIDVKAGTPGGTDHGFAFIAPTVRKSKTTGEPVAYRWLKPPDLTQLDAEDRSGEKLAGLVRHARGARKASSGALFQQPATRGQLGDLVPPGGRHAALISYAGWLRSHGLPLAEAEALILARFRDLEQPPGNAPYTEDDALAKLRDVYARYPPGDPAAENPEDAELAALAERREINIRKRLLRVDAEARAELAAEHMPAMPAALGGAEFLAQPDEQAAWRVNGLWPAGGNVVLAAQFKAGKTTLAGNLARSWCDGMPFLAAFEVTAAAGPLLLIDTEMSPASARRWLRDQGIGQPARFRYVNIRGQATALDVLTAAGQARWAELAAGCSGVVLDCLGPALGALGLDESSNPDVIRWLAGWDKMLALAHITESLVIVHMGHDAERARGASRLRDWPDAEWRLVRQDSDPGSPRYLSAYGRDVDVPESRLAYDAAARMLTVAGGSRRDDAGVAILADARELLTGEPWQSGNRLERALTGAGHGQKLVRAALAAAVRSGDLTIKDGPRNARLYNLTSSVRRTSSDEVRSSSSHPFGGDELTNPDTEGDLVNELGGVDPAPRVVLGSCARCYAPCNKYGPGGNPLCDDCRAKTSQPEASTAPEAQQ